MIFGVDTNSWHDDLVVKSCKELNIEYKGGFYLQQTKTKLASAMLKQATANYLNQPLSSIEVSQNGKPFFPKGQFNITHHEHIALCVVSKTQQVGIDLTSEKTPFSAQDCEILFSNMPVRTGVCWAAREAYLKYVGTGLSEKPVEISEKLMDIPDILNIGTCSLEIEKVHAFLFKVDEYVGAVIAPLEDTQEFVELS